MWNNTSIVQDEVLAQRLGLIPLAIDPEKLQAKACASLSLLIGLGGGLSPRIRCTPEGNAVARKALR